MDRAGVSVHPFHLVDCSPWPILLSFAMLSGAISVVSWMNIVPVLAAAPVFGILLVILFLWWRDVIREAKGGFHTTRVQRGILIGFLLFLLSEVMLFVSFFWAFFHSSLSPNVELAALWPHGINLLDPWAIPLLGSSVLLASGFILTLGHHAFIRGHKSHTLLCLLFTVLLGAVFLLLQYNEYYNSEFTIADSVFGCIHW